jgi:hypothetical protein
MQRKVLTLPYFYQTLQFEESQMTGTYPRWLPN